MTVTDERLFCTRCGNMLNHPLHQGQGEDAHLFQPPDDLGPLGDEVRDEAAGRRSWRPVDLTSILNGSYEPPEASVGARDDGVGLFYLGRVHSVASESEGGKTWLALAATKAELEAGNAVVYLDFEDDVGGVVGRLLAIGTDRDAIAKRFAYIRPEDGIGPLLIPSPNRRDLAEVLADLQPVLVVLDGITEAMTLHGLELKDNGDVARFGNMLPRWIADQGPAVVALDHVVKDKEGHGRYAIGGVHKLNGINGAAFQLRNRKPFGIGITGRSGLFIAKDRPGQLRRHAQPSAGGLHWLADLVLTSHHEAFVEVSIEPPAAPEESTGFRPTAVMAKVARVLAERPGLSKNAIEVSTGGKATVVRAALELLVAEGYVSQEKAGQALKHTLVRPFEEGA